MFALIMSIFLGGISGWIAGLIRRGKGFGIIGNVVVGFIGAYIGNIIFGFLGLNTAGGPFWTVFISVIGALTLSALINIFVD